MKAVVARLARKIKDALALRQRQEEKGRLDSRRTIRKSLQYGGVPMEVRFRRRHREKPKLITLCDVSDSVRNASRFMLQLVWSLQECFSPRALLRLRVRDRRGHPGLQHLPGGHARSTGRSSRRRWTTTAAPTSATRSAASASTELESLDRKTTVLILGDARNNYNDPQAWAIRQIRERVKGIIWLNPEGQWGWGIGDSVMPLYAPACDIVRECRTIGQLGEVVDQARPPVVAPRAADSPALARRLLRSGVRVSRCPVLAAGLGRRPAARRRRRLRRPRGLLAGRGRRVSARSGSRARSRAGASTRSGGGRAALPARRRPRGSASRPRRESRAWDLEALPDAGVVVAAASSSPRAPTSASRHQRQRAGRLRGRSRTRKVSVKSREVRLERGGAGRHAASTPTWASPRCACCAPARTGIKGSGWMSASTSATDYRQVLRRLRDAAARAASRCSPTPTTRRAAPRATTRPFRACAP